MKPTTSGSTKCLGVDYRSEHYQHTINILFDVRARGVVSLEVGNTWVLADPKWDESKRRAEQWNLSPEFQGIEHL
ncbi:MAG: hypothetical protein QOF01_802, partial [Thermomicrobiales bacterium]|nr:hypothetical protein [Thermomicrobiales bacterium]